MISNCGHDENGRYSGGKAGDQTGGEYCVRTWYSRPWKCVIRFDEKARKAIAKIAKDAALSKFVGYDQSQRLTYYNELKKVKWDASKIKTKCESDCSASTSAAIIGAGYIIGNTKMQSFSPSNTTWGLRAACKAIGATILTDAKYLTTDNYLLEGDILLKDDAHVAINLTKGASATTTSSTTATKTPSSSVAKPTLKKGSKSGEVGKLQKNLNKVLGCKLAVDNSFGDATLKQVKAFQKKYKLEVDGIYGAKSAAKMDKLI